MSNIDMIRAWKDEDYRNSLSAEQRSQLPENPAGMMEMPDEVTQTLAGGGKSSHKDWINLFRKSRQK